MAQYPFDGATDEEKSELLKDVLAFANAWRQTDAHILIGVEEVRGGRSIVRGVSHHLLNRNLQQFVVSKTNRPVSFVYTPLAFEGVEMGVLTIPLQDRPVYLTKRYGKLQQQIVYIRRGDTTGTAAPDEVARMGSSAALTRSQPVLEIEFGNTKDRTTFGTTIHIGSVLLEIPDPKAIPLYGPAPHPLLGDDIYNVRNRNYYREYAEYLRNIAQLCPVALAVSNPSPTVAEEVIVVMSIDAVPGLKVVDGADAPHEPSKSTFGSIPPGVYQRGRAVSVARYGELFEIKAEIGTVQPGTTRWSPGSFYIGAQSPMIVAARIVISANNLQVPISLTAEMNISTRSQAIGMQDITGSRPDDE